MKCGHRSLPPVETENIFVEIRGEIGGLDPVMRAGEPSFEIRKHPVNMDRDDVCKLRASYNPLVMHIPLERGFRVALPAVRTDHRSGLHVRGQKAADGFPVCGVDAG